MILSTFPTDFNELCLTKHTDPLLLKYKKCSLLNGWINVNPFRKSSKLAKFFLKRNLGLKLALKVDKIYPVSPFQQ